MIIAFISWLTCVLGNIVLVASVYYAKLTGRHGFDSNKKWYSSTIFFVNIAVVDLGYCLFALANGLYAIHVQKHYHSEYWDPSSSHEICKFIVHCRKNLSIIDGWSTAAISFNAAFPRIRQAQRLQMKYAKYHTH